MRGPLARPATPQDQPPRRGELTREERDALVFMLRDYAEMLESFAAGVDDGGPIDQETRKRADCARDIANRFK